VFFARFLNSLNIIDLGKELANYFAYLEVDEILRRLLNTSRHSSVYRLLLEHTRMTNTDMQNNMRDYDRLTNTEKARRLMEASASLRKKGLDMYERHYDHELLCEHIVETLEDSPRVFNYVFGHVEDESELYDSIRKYLKREYSIAFHTDHLKREGWPDFFACDKGWGEKNLVAVDAKTQFNEYKRFLNQASTFMRYSDRVFLATTPGLVIEIGRKITELAAYGSQTLENVLNNARIGLLVVDVTGGSVTRQINAQKHSSLDREEQDRCIKKLEYYFPNARGFW